MRIPMGFIALFFAVVSVAPAGCQSGSGSTSPGPSVFEETGAEFKVEELDQRPSQRGRWAEPVYPLEMKRAGKTGFAVISFVITTQGAVTQVRIIKATHPLFGEAAVNAVSQWRFNPGIKCGKTVNCLMTIPIGFELG